MPRRLKDTNFLVFFLWFDQAGGEIVLACIKENKMIEELSLEEFKVFSPIFEEDIYHAIDLLTCVEERKVIGGPSTESVKMQISALENFINEFKSVNN